MILTALTNAELLRHAEAQHDELTSTPIETELLRRFGVIADELAAKQSLLDSIENFGIDLNATDDLQRVERALDWEAEWDPKVYRPLLEALSSHDIDDAATLHAALDRDRDLESVLDDLADPIARLQRLGQPQTANQGAN